MKKIILFSIYIVLACTIGCGTKHKIVQEERQETIEHTDSISIKHDSLVSNKDTLNENECFENTGDADIDIIKPDGTKIHLPKNGSYKRSNNKIHTNIRQTQNSVLNVKKTTNTDKYKKNYKKDVERKPFSPPFWLWILLIVIIIYIKWRLDNKA